LFSIRNNFPGPLSPFYAAPTPLASGVAQNRFQWRRQGGTGQLPPTLSRIDPEISTNPMRNNHNCTIDLDSDGYFDLCKKKQNHCLAQLAERRSWAGELTLSCARPAADG